MSAENKPCSMSRFFPGAVVHGDFSKFGVLYDEGKNVKIINNHKTLSVKAVLPFNRWRVTLF